MKNKLKNKVKITEGKDYRTVTMIIKYAASLLLALAAVNSAASGSALLCTILELAAILFATNLLFDSKPWVAFILNDILIFLLNVQNLVMIFSGGYVTLVMITNVDSLEDLSGSIVTYGIGALLVIVLSILPVKKISIRRVESYRGLSAVLALELILIMSINEVATPVKGYIDLCKDEYYMVQQKRKILTAEDCTKDFYKNGVAQFYHEENPLGKKPNIVLIFTEGLSQNIVSDSRKIMPNVAKYEKKSLWFTNYFNHTFATYRGLIGQLYSGYQLENLDENNLISVQEVLSHSGYKTSFVNTEPNNSQFTLYLERMKFDKVIGSSEMECKGEVNSLSDKQAYELLYDIIEKQHEEKKPFFTAMYAFGTHVSFDSPDEKYGDGTNKILNKFYNSDAQFGKFMEKFEKSPMSEDTMIVFTADHATYAESEYLETFESVYHRDHPSLDQVPFFIYHKGVKAEEIDVEGRNSLDLVPTLLDYVNIDGENYFLGTTLFVAKDNGNNFDTIYKVGGNTVTSRDGNLAKLSKTELSIIEPEIEKYYIAKFQGH